MSSSNDPSFWDSEPAKKMRSIMIQAEQLGEEILTDKQQIVDMDRRRNINREAWRAIKTEQKVWLCTGNTMFIQMPSSKAKGILEKEQHILDEEINKLRDQLKVKTSKLNEIEERTDNTQPFYLKPSKMDELFRTQNK